MVNLVWFLLLFIGGAVATWRGRLPGLTEAVGAAGRQGIETILGMMGIMAIWMGVLRIAERAGLVDALARGLRPAFRRLFPGVPPEHPAMSAILLNISANVLGVGSAATPFGLRAMEELQRLNPDPAVASPAMCTFLAMNTTSVTLLPATVIALRSLYGSHNPAEIILSTVIATSFSTGTALVLDYIYRRRLRTRTGII